MATWGIMLANIAIFVAVAGLNANNQGAEERLLNQMAFDPVAFGIHKAPTGVFQNGLGTIASAFLGERVPHNQGHWWTLITYQFAHAGFMHILGNLLILWVFGPSVEDRFGRIGFTVFYLAGGVLAALLHGYFEPYPVVGASGAIAAVTGAFLVLFPRTRIKLLFFFVLVGVYEIPAWVFIVLAVAKDVWGSATHGENIAFLAHIGGYSFGFCVSMLLLITHVLPQEDWTLFAIARHAKRRAEFKAAAREADLEWKRKIERPADPTPMRRRPARSGDADSNGSGTARNRPAARGAGVEERVLWQRMDADEARALTEVENTRFAALRADLAAKVAAGDASGASAAMRAVLKEGRGSSGNRRVLVEAGNLFTASGRHQDAADAYEAFLTSLKGMHDAEEGRVRLMLALVYQRYLKRPAKAATALAGIKGSFSDPELHALAESLRDELRPAT